MSMSRSRLRYVHAYMYADDSSEIRLFNILFGVYAQLSLIIYFIIIMKTGMPIDVQGRITELPTEVHTYFALAMHLVPSHTWILARDCAPSSRNIVWPSCLRMKPMGGHTVAYRFGKPNPERFGRICALMRLAWTSRNRSFGAATGGR